MEKRLRFSSSFLDRLEEVGTVTMEDAVDYGLVGPVARASGVAGDLRTCLPYGDYGSFEFSVPVEKEGDGYARLRILFQEAEQSNNIISQAVSSLPGGGIRQPLSPGARPAGAALGWAETPLGATFHWVRLAEDGRVARYRLTTPSFTNWHGFHLSVEGFAFQDFPIILATFGLSNAECDR
ncbi:MAG TPA: NADH-quinone oxidoreductase subunit F, partial [Desulfobacteraceae bacterium]|nr:NADH-quinone oxidoreductase subunit F [Desulfobacteraceae bacterium]